jgi:hypothetical protein
MCRKLQSKLEKLRNFLLDSEYYKKFYKWLSRSYMLIFNFLNTPNVLLAAIGAIVVFIVVFLSTRGNIYYASIALLIPHVFFILVLLFFGLILKFLKHTGVDHQFTFPGKYLIRQFNACPCELDLSKVDLSKFQFADDSTAMITAELNSKGFSKTAWAGSVEEKYKRNAAHIRQNKYCILLIKNNAGDYVGFSHIIPVTKSTWEDYMNGKIKDSIFSYKLITPTVPMSDEEKPAGLIAFSIAYIKDKDNPFDPFIDKGEILEQAKAYHLKILCETYFSSTPSVPVLFQNMGEKFWRFFKDCLTSDDKISADGVRIITYNVTQKNMISPQ